MNEDSDIISYHSNSNKKKKFISLQNRRDDYESQYSHSPLKWNDSLKIYNCNKEDESESKECLNYNIENFNGNSVKENLIEEFENRWQFIEKSKIKKFKKTPFANINLPINYNENGINRINQKMNKVKSSFQIKRTSKSYLKRDKNDILFIETEKSIENLRREIRKNISATEENFQFAKMNCLKENDKDIKNDEDSLEKKYKLINKYKNQEIEDKNEENEISDNEEIEDNRKSLKFLVSQEEYSNCEYEGNEINENSNLDQENEEKYLETVNQKVDIKEKIKDVFNDIVGEKDLRGSLAQSERTQKIIQRYPTLDKLQKNFNNIFSELNPKKIKEKSKEKSIPTMEKSLNKLCESKKSIKNFKLQKNYMLIEKITKSVNQEENKIRLFKIKKSLNNENADFQKISMKNKMNDKMNSKIWDKNIIIKPRYVTPRIDKIINN